MRRWFITSYLLLLAVLTATAVTLFFAEVHPWSAAGLLLAAGSGLAFFVWLLTFRPPRTSAHPLPVTLGMAAGAVLAMVADWRYGTAVAWLIPAIFVVLVGWVVYLRWYSRLPAPHSAPRAGERLPFFTLRDRQGHEVSSAELAGQPAVLLFYRGNWCPLCTAQIHEVAGHWQKIAAAGGELWLISSQSEVETEKIAARFSIPARFLRDAGNQAARTLGIEAPGAAPAGMALLGHAKDAALPAVMVVDREGVIRYIEIAANYRLRPAPEAYLGWLAE